jgi:hypothetical protein
VTKQKGAKVSEFTDIAAWLQNEAEELAKAAMSREDMARNLRDSTVADLKGAKILAEKMSGRKLPAVKTSLRSARIDAEVQEKIAAKLTAESLQLTKWADFLRERGA